MEVKGFVGPTYRSQVFTQDQEDVFNLFLENAESQGATAQASFIRVPGVELRGTASIAPGRANFAQSGRNFAVCGSQLLEIDQFWNITVRGTLAVDGNPATICSNGDGGDQLFITSGGNGYCYVLTTNVLTQVLTGDASQGDFLDGYFIAFNNLTSTFRISDLLDGTTWDPTQFAQRSTAGDPWVSMKVANRFIYLLGQETSEVWYNAGSFPFPFEPHPSGFMQYGCAATFSPEVLAGALYWLGQTSNGTGIVLQASGFSPNKISTYPINRELAEFSSISDAIGDAYEENGHQFYLLHLPAADVTFAYDAATNNWAKRGTWISEDNTYVATRYLYHAFCFGQHRYLDRETGSIYQASLDYGFDVESRELRFVRRSPSSVDENKRVQYSYFEILCDVGIGLVSGQGSDPKMMMRYSDDGGRTWGNEISKSVGKLGEYNTRVRWDRCGTGRKRVWEVSGTDPIMWRIVGAYMGAEQLDA